MYKEHHNDTQWKQQRACLSIVVWKQSTIKQSVNKVASSDRKIGTNEKPTNDNNILIAISSWKVYTWSKYRLNKIQAE